MIETLVDLMEAVSDIRTGGYEVDVEVEPRRKRYQVNDEFWLVIIVNTNYPGKDYEGLAGDYWFYDDGTIMQVL